MFSLNGTLKKKWVGRAMGNETIYWDGLITLTYQEGNVFAEFTFESDELLSVI